MIIPMTLREMMIERILFAFSDDELQVLFDISEDEVEMLGDLDLLELYDETLLYGVQGDDSDE